jgi:hypothetical protein
MLVLLSSALRKALIIIGSAYLIAVVAIVLTLCISLLFLCKVVREFFKFRSPRGLWCPETNEFAIVRLDALHASVTSVLDTPDLRLVACSRWPEHQNCDRACLRGMETRAKVQRFRPAVLS